MQRLTSSGKCIGLLGALLGTLCSVTPAEAQVSNGFAVNRYEPTAAGEWSFWVDHPWYSSMRYLAAGITLNYAHNPLVFGRVNSDGSFSQATSVIEHQFLGHVDIAGSFLDRVMIAGTVPITFLERGTPAAGAAPANGVAAGDPRLGFWVRLFGQPYKSAVSLSLGAQAWIPLRSFGVTSGVALTSSDEGVLRVMPKLALSGYAKHILWSFNAGFLYRPAARIGTGVTDDGSTVGSELQLGAAVAYADMQRRFAIGPEAILGTQVLGTDSTAPFTRNYTSLELLLGGHYNISNKVNVGLAGGIGLLRTPGTPDGRVLLRIGYAPMKEEVKQILDRDEDGILDAQDACPDDPGIATDDARTHGCPDRDRDGFLDADDKCPDEPGVAPDGCPLRDKDGDGILDKDDKCVDVPETRNGYEDTDGCPDELPKAVAKFTGVIRGIYFDFGKDSIRKQSTRTLSEAAKIFVEYPSLKVEISGHTDDVGKIDYNKDLSRRRAESVKAYLVSKGVAAERITTRGAGPDEPIAENKTAKGRAKNRRIEFKIVLE